MKTIKTLTKPDVKDIVVKELKKKNKIIYKGEVEAIARKEILKNNKEIYRYLDKLRKKILKFEVNQKIKIPKNSCS